MSWKVTAAFPDQEDPITLTFDHAWTDRQMKAYPIKVNGHWNIAGEGEGRDCTAIWTTPKPVPLPAGTTLTFEMQGHDDENLGHFRLSVSGDPAAIDREQKTFAARKLTDPWQKLAAAYQLQGKPDQVDQLVARRPKLAGRVGDLLVQGPDAGQGLATRGRDLQPGDYQRGDRRRIALEAGSRL